MWKDKLEEIKKLKIMFGEQINKGADKEDIIKFTNTIEERVDIYLPEKYIDILRVVNGLEFNGHILYGIDERLLMKKNNQYINGFIDLNETWHENENLKQYAFIGESDMSWFVYERNTNKYRELDKPSGRELYEFQTLEEMIEKLFSSALV